MYKYLIGIDPAGIGKTGIVIYDIENKNILTAVTYESTSDELSIDYFLDLMKTFKKLFEKTNNNKFNNVLVLIENFYLNKNRTITNPISTPIAIGGIKAIIKHIFKWDIIVQQPIVKKKIRYKGNFPFTEHELDAWKHIQYYLNQN